MPEKIIEIKSYIFGEFKNSPDYLRKKQVSIYGNVLTEVHEISQWGLISSVQSTINAQRELYKISVEKRIALLQLTMNYYFPDDSGYEIMVKLSGSPFHFVKQGIEQMKGWCKDGLNSFLSSALIGASENIRYNSTSPVVAIMPSNSEQEVLYVIAQALLSGNAIIMRPSSHGASAYSAFEIAKAYNLTLEKIQENPQLKHKIKINDHEISILKNAISIVNYSERDFLDYVCLNNWNYLVFGDNNSVNRVEEIIRERCKPRKVLGYGTGLSTSVICEDADLDKTAEIIIESVALNRGDECVGTDIIYCHQKISKKLLDHLCRIAERYRGEDPLLGDSIGVVNPSNINFLKGEILKRSKLEFLKTEYKNGIEYIHTSVIPLTDFETAIEYPGPILSVRVYTNLEHLKNLIEKDLHDNKVLKNLTTSVFTKKHFDEIFPVLKSYLVKRNIGTHQFNFDLPHQGNFIVRELSDRVDIDKQ